MQKQKEKTMLKAELINKKGVVVAIVRQTSKDFTHCFRGFLTIPTSWDIVTNNSLEEEFLAECRIKWDGCSHFWYYGEDFLTDGIFYPYYHECGLNEYYKVFVAKLFAFEVAKYYMKDTIESIEENMDDDLYDTIDRVNVLDFYTINYSEFDENNDLVHHKYLKNRGG